jgi:putative transposase
MTRVEDRRTIACDIEQAQNDGASYQSACQLAGVSLRTLQRWKARAQVGVIQGDSRPGALHPTPAHALSEEERRQIISVANESRFADMP